MQSAAWQMLANGGKWWAGRMNTHAFIHQPWRLDRCNIHSLIPPFNRGPGSLLSYELSVWTWLIPLSLRNNLSTASTA